MVTVESEFGAALGVPALPTIKVEAAVLENKDAVGFLEEMQWGDRFCVLGSGLMAGLVSDKLAEKGCPLCMISTKRVSIFVVRSCVSSGHVVREQRCSRPWTPASVRPCVAGWLHRWATSTRTPLRETKTTTSLLVDAT